MGRGRRWKMEGEGQRRGGDEGSEWGTDGRTENRSARRIPPLHTKLGLICFKSLRGIWSWRPFFESQSQAQFGLWSPRCTISFGVEQCSSPCSLPAAQQESHECSAAATAVSAFCV